MMTDYGRVFGLVFQLGLAVLVVALVAAGAVALVALLRGRPKQGGSEQDHFPRAAPKPPAKSGP